MRTSNRSPYRRSVLFLGTMLMFAAPTVACMTDPVASQPDPRLGRDKRILFSSGCMTSVTMPVGATDTITMQAAQDGATLPADLVPKSADPTIIEVLNPSATTFDMHALKKGQTDIEVLSAGAHFDALTFHAEPAKAVVFSSEPAIIAGGRTGLAITDVFGACGTDKCPLFGHTFVKWSAEPAAAFTFLEDTKNLAHYQASITPGQGALVGTEPSEGGELLRQTIEIVDPAMITGLTGTLKNTASTGDGKESPQVPLPTSVPANAFFEVRIRGERSGKPSVAISRFDVEWTVPPGIGQVPVTEPSDPFAAVFSASDMTGDFTITAKVGLLAAKEQQFVVTVKAP